MELCYSCEQWKTTDRVSKKTKNDASRFWLEAMSKKKEYGIHMTITNRNNNNNLIQDIDHENGGRMKANEIPMVESVDFGI